MGDCDASCPKPPVPANALPKMPFGGVSCVVVFSSFFSVVCDGLNEKAAAKPPADAWGLVSADFAAGDVKSGCAVFGAVEGAVYKNGRTFSHCTPIVKPTVIDALGAAKPNLKGAAVVDGFVAGVVVDCAAPGFGV